MTELTRLSPFKIMGCSGHHSPTPAGGLKHTPEQSELPLSANQVPRISATRNHLAPA